MKELLGFAMFFLSGILLTISSVIPLFMGPKEENAREVIALMGFTILIVVVTIVLAVTGIITIKIPAPLPPLS